VNIKNHVRHTILVAFVAGSTALAFGAVGTAQAAMRVPGGAEAADDSTADESAILHVRKAGGDQHEMRKAGGEPQDIIAIL
jgi:hypothetical protein